MNKILYCCHHLKILFQDCQSVEEHLYEDHKTDHFSMIEMLGKLEVNVQKMRVVGIRTPEMDKRQYAKGLYEKLVHGPNESASIAGKCNCSKIEASVFISRM